MKFAFRSTLLALALLAGTHAQAAPVIGSGGGYYGSAWFTGSNGGVVVGPYSTWSACDDALQFAIDYRVTNWGWTVDTYSGCTYRPPFAGFPVHADVQIDLQSTTPLGSLSEAAAASARIRSIRRQFNADAYDEALRSVR
jgi:hypothetical protein